MSRDQWRQRLLDAELPETVVDELLASLKDEDLVRMKDMSPEQVIETLQKGVNDNPSANDKTVVKDDNPPVVDKTVVKDDDPPADDNDDSLVKSFEALGAYVAGVVKEALESHAMEVEIPALPEIQASLAEIKEDMVAFKELSKIMKDMLESDEERLKGIVRDMSQASRNRLRHSLDDAGIIKRVVKKMKERDATLQRPGSQAPSAPGYQPVCRDAQGNVYANMTDMMQGNPIAE